MARVRVSNGYTWKEMELRAKLLRNRVEHQQILNELYKINGLYKNAGGRPQFNREIKRLEQVDIIKRLVKGLTWEDLGYTTVLEIALSNDLDAIIRFREKYPDIVLHDKQIYQIIQLLNGRTGLLLGKGYNDESN